MRRSTLSMLLLLMIGVIGLAMAVWVMVSSNARETSDSVAIADSVPVTASDPITAGVILTGEATMFGWGDLAFEGDYADLTLAGQRVIVYENLNPTDRPGVTFEEVVAEMAERYTPRAYFFSVGRLTPDEIKVDERYANTVFIMNLATRADVETLLRVLPATKPDLNHTPIMNDDDVAAAPQTAPVTHESEPDSSSIPTVLIVMLLALVVVGGVLGRWWNRFSPLTVSPAAKKKTKRHLSASVHAKALAIEEVARERATDFAAIGESAPVIHELTTYVFGDDYFDESFPVELPDKTFLGECGLSIAAPVNRYHAGKVTAFEAWLFDKQGPNTVSATLLSEHAANDPTLRDQFTSDNPLIEAKPGVAIQLETTALRIRICVLDQQYGFLDTLPQRSFFDHLVVELAVWQR